MSKFFVIIFRFHRGQPVFVESKEAGKVPGVIAAVGAQEVSFSHSGPPGHIHMGDSTLFREICPVSPEISLDDAAVGQTNFCIPHC
jgi:hypothetical protein